MDLGLRMRLELLSGGINLSFARPIKLFLASRGGLTGESNLSLLNLTAHPAFDG